MKIGELRTAMARFPPDMDDTEVFMMTSVDNKTTYDQLTGFGYITFDENVHPVLVGLSEIQRRVESGEMDKPDGYFPPKNVEGDEWKNG
jgi:hypothetical protein